MARASGQGWCGGAGSLVSPWRVQWPTDECTGGCGNQWVPLGARTTSQDGTVPFFFFFFFLFFLFFPSTTAHRQLTSCAKYSARLRAKPSRATLRPSTIWRCNFSATISWGRRYDNGQAGRSRLGAAFPSPFFFPLVVPPLRLRLLTLAPFRRRRLRRQCRHRLRGYRRPRTSLLA